MEAMTALPHGLIAEIESGEESEFPGHAASMATWPRGSRPLAEPVELPAAEVVSTLAQRGDSRR